MRSMMSSGGVLVAILLTGVAWSQETKSPLDKLDRGKMSEFARTNTPDATVALVETRAKLPIRASALSATRLATGDQKGGVHLWDLTGADPRELPFPADQALAGVEMLMAFSSDGRLLAVHGAGILSVFEMVDGGAKLTLRIGSNAARGMSFHPGGALAVSAGDGRLYSLTPRALVPLPVSLRGAAGHNEFSKDGKFFAAVSSSPDRRGEQTNSEITFWKVDPKRVVEFGKITESGMMHTFALSADNKFLVTSPVSGKKLHLWDISGDNGANKTEPRLKIDSGDWMKHLWFTPDGERIVGVNVGTIKIWKRSTGELEHSWKWEAGAGSPYNPGTTGNIATAAFAPDGRHLAVSPHANAMIILRLPASR